MKRFKDRPGRFAWQCTCPFHLKSSSPRTRCTRTKDFATTRETFAEDSKAVLLSLRVWALAYADYDRAWKHQAYYQDPGQDWDTVAAQVVGDEPEADALSDGALDIQPAQKKRRRRGR